MADLKRMAGIRSKKFSDPVSSMDLNPLHGEVYTPPMSTNLPLETMTLQEKLAAMEMLWDELARSPESVESPSWHKDILEGRRDQVTEGKANFVDWETAKKDIRSKIS